MKNHVCGLAILVVLLSVGCAPDQSEEPTPAEAIVNLDGFYWLCSPWGGLQNSIRMQFLEDGSGVVCSFSEMPEPVGRWTCNPVSWELGGNDNSLNVYGGWLSIVSQINPNDTANPTYFQCMATSASGTGQVVCSLASGTL